MANPFSRGALTSFPASGNLVAMPAGTSLGLGVVSGVITGAPYADIVIAPMQLKTGTGAVSINGYVNIYLITSEDNTVWTGTISPTATGSQTALVGYATLADQLTTPASGTIYVSQEFSVWSKLGFIPSYCAVVVSNMTGATLDVSGANFSCKYALDSYT